ncbi:YgjV family protein [Larsenimonas salina]|uniref:YgjV family protein n=1 Tax=Larsenimonas salina TaxID=1295565 RepID=UPI002074A6A4|nr:YgjV family protein [Larsenimonas salina]MCM5705104.1 YgjV family protein [Larsenimonas salina]
MFESLTDLAGQFFGLASLVLCILAFLNTRDDRLMALLLLANAAFALQFAFFQSWTASILSVLVMVRIALARRYPGHRGVMMAVLIASGLAAWLTWQSLADAPALVAMLIGTVSMFLLKGVALRVCMALAAAFWLASHLLAGSIGGVTAEAMVILANAITITRLIRRRQKNAAPPGVGEPDGHQTYRA